MSCMVFNEIGIKGKIGACAEWRPQRGFYLYLFQALCFYIDNRNFVRYFSRIKDTWIATIESNRNISWYVIPFPLIRVFEHVFRRPSVLNAQASCFDRCCGILNVSTLHKFHDTGGGWKKDRPFDVCAQSKFFLFHENISYISVPWLSSNTHKQFF